MGVHHGSLRLLADDGLSIDNERFFTIAVYDAWPILVVAPKNVAAHLMTEAVAPYQFRQTNQAKFRCEVIKQSEFRAFFTSFANFEPTPPSPITKIGSFT